MELHIGHLYPKTMSTYGDTGNIICLINRCRWRGINTVVHQLDVDTAVPEQIDLYFFGGGQDAAQSSLERDLLEKKADRLLTDTAAGVPLLAICGGYQLLGASYHPFDSPVIRGVGLFPVETRASHDRMIGDLVITANPRLNLPADQPEIVGFENHSGKTVITDPEKGFPLGTVRHGFGNNGSDRTEGCVTYNSIGCYLHGSLLPKNPRLADWLIEKAGRRHDPDFHLTPLDDRLEWQAHAVIVGRYA
ncbi:glutamine amidotransferase [Patescibacteria group bacterium]|nr:glutamine amidotransferase [Patescibacteria group bacterium]